jgi:hypothetical protein
MVRYPLRRCFYYLEQAEGVTDNETRTNGKIKKVFEKSMSNPNLTIAVEPVENGKAVYLPIAPADASKGAWVKIVLRLRITNNENEQVVVSGIQFSFPDSQVAPVTMQGVAMVLIADGQKKASDAIGPGQTATWSNGVVDLNPDPKISNLVSNVVYLPVPSPSKILASVYCDGFTSPASIALDLARYTSPTPAGAFLFPFIIDHHNRRKSAFFFQTSPL